jgi:hypothetical protein
MPPFSKLPSNFPAIRPLRISGLTFDLGNALMAGMHLDHTQSSSRVTQIQLIPLTLPLSPANGGEGGGEGGRTKKEIPIQSRYA